MSTSTRISHRDRGPAATGALPGYQEIALTVNAYLMADKQAAEGNVQAAEDKKQHLRLIQGRFWRVFLSVLSGNLTRRRNVLEFTDDERLFMDTGLVDARMLGGDRPEMVREMVAELNTVGNSTCYYLTEWLIHRNQQLQLENDLSGSDEPETDYASQLREVRRRILSRLANLFTGLPGIPLELSEAMRSGDLDNAVIHAGIVAAREPRRRNLIRRRNLWNLREQVLAKARARVGNAETLRLVELLNDLYARDWRERYDSFQITQTVPEQHTQVRPADVSISVNNPNLEILMSEAREIRMRLSLMAAIDDHRPDPVMIAKGMRLNKTMLAEFLPLCQTFDRALLELPPMVMVPGSGRGFYAWETGCVFLSIRPLVGVDDSIATSFAWLRMLDDRMNRGGALRTAYEKKFPGAVFANDFPVDYRAWLTRLTKGDASALNSEKRAFFRDYIGPDINGPILPPNLRNIGPQTMVAICRRMEKQLTSDDKDVNIHRRLAALYWKQENYEAAGVQFNVAMQLAPDDGETLFSAGMFMRARGDNDAAKDCFKFGAKRAANSLWGIYCQDALANQL